MSAEARVETEEERKARKEAKKAVSSLCSTMNSR